MNGQTMTAADYLAAIAATDPTELAAHARAHPDDWDRMRTNCVNLAEELMTLFAVFKRASVVLDAAQDLVDTGTRSRVN